MAGRGPVQSFLGTFTRGATIAVRMWPLLPVVILPWLCHDGNTKAKPIPGRKIIHRLQTPMASSTSVKQHTNATVHSRRCYSAKSMGFGRFGRLLRATAWLFLAWTVIDLAVPRLCALDREQAPVPIHSSAARIDVPSAPLGTTPTPVHVDDCFCCSHCVNVTGIHAPASLALARTEPPLPTAWMPLTDGYPQYHPPRA